MEDKVFGNTDSGKGLRDSSMTTVNLKLKASRNQLSRQDDMVMRLQEELEDSRRKATDLKSQLKESHIKFSNLEGKLKDEQLMSRIKDAENTHSIAELRHQISSLELKVR